MVRHGRQRKRDRRMDAAVDAMSLFGFSKSLVVRTVKELLKVYGADNWLFIEQDSYRVLLDRILEEQEANRDAEASNVALVVSSSDAEAWDEVPVLAEPLGSEVPDGALDLPLLSDGNECVPPPRAGSGCTNLVPVSKANAGNSHGNVNDVETAAVETVRRDVISEGNIGRNHANNDGETGDMSSRQDPVINSNRSPSCLTPFLFAKKKDPNLRRQVSATHADMAQHESLPHDSRDHPPLSQEERSHSPPSQEERSHPTPSWEERGCKRINLGSNPREQCSSNGVKIGDTSRHNACSGNSRRSSSQKAQPLAEPKERVSKPKESSAQPLQQVEPKERVSKPKETSAQPSQPVEPKETVPKPKESSRVPARRRPASYGWIRNDDKENEEDNNRLQLQPAPMSPELSEMVRRRDARRVQRNRIVI